MLSRATIYKPGPPLNAVDARSGEMETQAGWRSYSDNVRILYEFDFENSSEQFRHPSLSQWNVPVKQAYHPKRGVRIQNKGKRSDSVSLRVTRLHEPGLL